MFTRDSAIISRNIKTPLTSISRSVGNILQLTYGQLVKSLFANGEQGFFYDPNDLSTMYQNTAGTIPVTAVGQPVGLVLDKSKNLALGVEKKGAATTQLTGSANAATYNLSTGEATCERVDFSNQSFIRISGLTNTHHKVAITNTGTTPVSVRAGVNSVDQTILNVNAGQSATFYIVPSNGAVTLTSGTGSASFTINYIKALVGNHAYQTVSASRPVLGRHPTSGIRNIAQFNTDALHPSWGIAGMTKTGGKLDSRGTYKAVELKGQPTGVTSKVVKVPASDFYTCTICIKAGTLTTASVLLRNNTTVEQLGGGIVDLLTGSSSASSMTVKSKPNGFWEITIVSNKTVTAEDNLAIYYGFTSNTGLDANTSFTVDYCQLEQGKVATNLQVTTTPFDTTEAGFDNTYYLYFDGVDDHLRTSDIDFTSTDKVSLFAGVRKLSDATSGILVELSNSTLANNGAFHIEAPSGQLANNYGFASKGTIRQIAQSVASYPSPNSAVLVGIGVISTDTALLRINGIQSASSAGDQGVGNYGNYPLYIGRRGGTSLPFNGHLYGLIGIGCLTSDSETITLEKAIAKKIQG